MPSGSHRSSGGSHRSGGSRSSFGGGGSSFGGGHRHYHHYHRGGIYIGGAIPPRFVLPVIMFVFGFFALIFSFAFIFPANSYLNTIKEDYYYYQEMIVRAEQKGYIVDGTVTDMFLGEGGKYYIIYEIPKDIGYGNLEGETYSVYTRSEAYDLLGETIKIATNTKDVSSTTDSIPMDYKDMPLSKDGEYNSNLTKRTVGIMVLIGSVLLFAGGVVVLVRAIKKGPETKEDKKNETQNIETLESKYTECEYCGSKMLKTAVSCKNCGAKRNK